MQLANIIIEKHKHDLLPKIKSILENDQTFREGIDALQISLDIISYWIIKFGKDSISQLIDDDQTDERIVFFQSRCLNNARFCRIGDAVQDILANADPGNVIRKYDELIQKDDLRDRYIYLLLMTYTYMSLCNCDRSEKRKVIDEMIPLAYEIYYFHIPHPVIDKEFTEEDLEYLLNQVNQEREKDHH